MRLVVSSHSRNLLILLAGLFCFERHGYTQNETYDTLLAGNEPPRITWVKQWPTAINNQKPRGFRNRFNALFLGKQIPTLSRPVAVLSISQEDVWILDQGNHSVFNVQKELGDIPHFLQKRGFGFRSLIGICGFRDHSMLMTDSQENRIFLIDPKNKVVRVFIDSSTLSQPTGIAWRSSAHEIWVVETNAHCITVLDESGKILKRIGKRGTAEGEFNYPTHLWIDQKDMVYVVDAMNFRIQVFKPSGELVSVFGQSGDATGYFARPKGVATDSHGNIYIVDGLFHTVQVFDLHGIFLYNLGQQGQQPGEFWLPSGIFIDRDDNIYVADSYNSRIQVFHVVFAGKTH